MYGAPVVAGNPMYDTWMGAHVARSAHASPDQRTRCQVSARVARSAHALPGQRTRHQVSARISGPRETVSESMLRAPIPRLCLSQGSTRTPYGCLFSRFSA
eukprot:4806427-Pyramimonas_sp.AAC.1